MHFLYQSDSIFRPFCFINDFVEFCSKLNSKNLPRLFNFFFTDKDFKLKFYSQIQFNTRSTSDRLIVKGSKVRNDQVQDGRSKMVGPKWSVQKFWIPKWSCLDECLLKCSTRETPTRQPNPDEKGLCLSRLCLSTFNVLDYVRS